MNEPLLPIITHKDIENAYVSISASDVLYNTFETSTLITLTGDKLDASVCALTTTLTSSNSGYYQVARMNLFNKGFEATSSGLTGSIGVYSLRKRLFDTGLKKGTFTATVSGVTLFGDYYDSGSGQLIKKSDGSTHGSFLLDDGTFVVTSSESALVNSITAVRYKAKVLNTTLNVFCKCSPGQLNYSLNPTVFEPISVGDWMKEPFTSSTSASVFDYDLTLSGFDWQPTITSIGLYDDNKNLLAVAKLATPLKKPPDLPLAWHVKIDI